MSSLNVFIDGSWLFKACAPEKALAGGTEWPLSSFQLDFARLDSALLSYANAHRPNCRELGERYLATSIFNLPENFDNWVDEFEDVTAEDVQRTRKAVDARQKFADKATSAGYSASAIYYPNIKGWMLAKLRQGRFQEKQVDATVVALLVRSAIINPDDVHVVITGDADVIPAIRVAYPEYSRNVVVATTHPDELKAERRQTSFSLSNFDFDIDPFYFQDHLAEIMSGAFVYSCAHCHKVFSRPKSIPTKQRPCCQPCFSKRER